MNQKKVKLKQLDRAARPSETEAAPEQPKGFVSLPLLLHTAQIVESNIDAAYQLVCVIPTIRACSDPRASSF